jgi:hypothetical protein
MGKCWIAGLLVLGLLCAFGCHDTPARLSGNHSDIVFSPEPPDDYVNGVYRLHCDPFLPQAGPVIKVGAVVEGTVQSIEALPGPVLVQESVLFDDRKSTIGNIKVLRGKFDQSTFAARYSTEGPLVLKTRQTYLFIFNPDASALLDCLDIQGDRCGFEGSSQWMNTNDLLRKIRGSGQLPKEIPKPI